MKKKIDQELLKNARALAKAVQFKPHKGIDGKQAPLDIRKVFKNEPLVVFLSRSVKGPFENLIFVDDTEMFSSRQIIWAIKRWDPYLRMEVYDLATKKMRYAFTRPDAPTKEYLLSKTRDHTHE